MKKLLVLILLNTTLFAQPLLTSIPLALQKKLCEQLANGSNRCDNGSTISYYKHAKLDGGRLLLFLYLDEHTTYPKPQFYSATPVMVDAQGRWISTVGENSMTESIDSIHLDPKGHVWVRAHWVIEGVHPAFYHSPDGLTWKRTRLPANREVDCCFERVDEPKFLHNSIVLTFRDFEDKVVKTWAASYQNAMSNNPSWQALTQIPFNTIEMLPNNHWQPTKNENEISFFNSYSKKKISLPLRNKKNKKRYKLQLGAYTKLSSAEASKKNLKNLDYGLRVVKEKKYIKLYLGNFTSYRKAEFILKKLKRQYPNNKSIQKAFIVTSKVQ